MFLPAQNVGDAQGEEWAAGREQKEPEEGGGRKDNFFFWQYRLISSAHKTVGSLHSDAGGIVIKNRSTETFVRLGLLFTFLLEAKKIYEDQNM